MIEKNVVNVEGQLFTTTLAISKALQMTPDKVHELIEKHAKTIRHCFPRGIKDAINLDEDHPDEHMKCLDYYAFYYLCNAEKLFYRLNGVNEILQQFFKPTCGPCIAEKLLMMSDSCVVYLDDLARMFDMTHDDLIEECERHPDINLRIEVEGDFGFYTFKQSDISNLLDAIDNERTREAKAELKNRFQNESSLNTPQEILRVNANEE